MSKIIFVALSTLFCSLPAISQAYTPPSDSAAILAGIDFSKATPIDEKYKRTFLDCDNKPGSHCRSDKNHLKALLKFPDGTIFYDSKMSLDLDGSFKGCGCVPKGKADQCQTSKEWVPGKPTTAEYRSEKDKCKFYKAKAFVDAGNFPYFVLPVSSEFVVRTGLKTGDLAAVIYKERIQFVFVADRGPIAPDKIGEGSAELIRLLDKDRCTARDTQGNCIKYMESSIKENVLAFIFPKSNISGLKPDTAQKVVEEAAKKRFEEFRKALR